MAEKVTGTSEEIQGWILKAAKETGIQVLILPTLEAGAAVKMVLTRYVTEGRTWWWEGLKLPSTQFDRDAMTLSEILPSRAAEIYLFPESDSGVWPVFTLRAGDLELLLNQCPYFEYSVMSADGSWFLTESHHDVIFLCTWP